MAKDREVAKAKKAQIKSKEVEGGMRRAGGRTVAVTPMRRGELKSEVCDS